MTFIPYRYLFAQFLKNISLLFFGADLSHKTKEFNHMLTKILSKFQQIRSKIDQAHCSSSN